MLVIIFFKLIYFKANSFSFSSSFIAPSFSFSIMPASLIPYEAKKNNRKIIEINISPSNFTNTITDIFLQGKATEIMKSLVKIL